MRLYFKHQRQQLKVNNSDLEGGTELVTPNNESHLETLNIINNQQFINFND